MASAEGSGTERLPCLCSPVVTDVDLCTVTWGASLLWIPGLSTHLASAFCLHLTLWLTC